MKFLFKPKSVAVIGASYDKKKLGYLLFENIVSGGYLGKIYPVNPRGGELLGLKVYTEIGLIDGDVDLAVFAIPTNSVFQAVKECVKKKIKYGVIITAGFADLGRAEEEKEIVDYAKKNGMRILGPNSMGYYSAEGSINATFAMPNVVPGGVAVISQSGGLGVALISKPEIRYLGLSAFFSIGNKSDIDDSELIEYLAKDKRTKVIMIYMEGLKKGEKLIRALKRATSEKPVIIIKSGTSVKGAKAASSHTGALACADDVFTSVMNQCNVLRTDSLAEAIDWAVFFVKTPVPKGENVLVITNGGGIGVMATDSLSKKNVSLYDDEKNLRKVFVPLISKFGSYKNPIDLTSDYTAETFDSTIKAALDHKDIHSVFIIHCQVPFCDINKFTKIIHNSFLYANQKGKSLILSLFGDESIDNSAKYLKEKGVPIFEDFFRGVSCLDAFFRYYETKKEEEVEEKSFLPKEAKKNFNSVIKKAIDEKRNFLLADEIREFLKILKIETSAGDIGLDINEAVMIAEKIGYPVAMKIVSPDVLHKSDVGGVVLNVKNKDEVKRTFELIRENCYKFNKEIRFQGIEVSRMLEAGTEIIVGAKRDTSFGPVVMCGLGGIYVEILGDVTFRAFPLSRNEVKRMLKELKTYPIFEGVRGEKPIDIESIIDTILKIGEVLILCPDVSDIELIPLFVYHERIKAVDARVMLKMNILNN